MSDDHVRLGTTTVYLHDNMHCTSGHNISAGANCIPHGICTSASTLITQL